MEQGVFIGPAGWSYKDWEGIVYPKQRGKKLDSLGYLAQFFDVIEINSSFYRPPTAQTTLKWIDLVRFNPNFKFTYKLWQVYTHNRETFPGVNEEYLVKSGLDQLKENDRLGALLIQFPWSFKNTPENVSYLQKILKMYQDYNPVVEIRHNSWQEPNFLSLLSDSGAAFANIDQPAIGNSIALTAHASRKVSYLRLHGRNFKNWFAKDADVASRYDYLYSEDELQKILETIAKIMEDSPKTFIIFNNHYRGQAVVNSLQMSYLLDGRKRKAPSNLIHTYPALEKIVITDEQATGQTSLF